MAEAYTYERLAAARERVEDDLRKRAAKLKLKDDEKAKYIYGTLHRAGLMRLGKTNEMSTHPLTERILAFAGKLDLGREPMDYCGAALGPAMPKPRKWYPNLYIDGSPNPIDLPDSGKATIEYKVTRKTTTDTDGKKRHEASLEIHSIEPEEKAKGEGRKAKMGAVPLKFSAVAPRVIAFRASSFRPSPFDFSLFFERPRNTDGEFAPQAEGVPDPSTMRAAYGHQPSSGLAKAGKVAGAAAGLGGTAAAALLLARKLRRK